LFKKEGIFFSCIIIFNLIFIGIYDGWHGDWSWGPRYLVPVIPFYLLPIFIFFQKKGVLNWIILSFALISLLLQLTGVLVNDSEYHQIRYIMVSKQISKEMPPDITGAFILLKHKLFQRDSIYNLSEFSIKSDAKVNTTEFETFNGFNLWYCHLARYYNKPNLRYLPLIFLPFLVFAFAAMLKSSNYLDGMG